MRSVLNNTPAATPHGHPSHHQHPRQSLTTYFHHPLHSNLGERTDRNDLFDTARPATGSTIQLQYTARDTTASKKAPHAEIYRFSDDLSGAVHLPSYGSPGTRRHEFWWLLSCLPGALTRLLRINQHHSQHGIWRIDGRRAGFDSGPSASR